MLTRDGPGFLQKISQFCGGGGVLFQNHGKKSLGITGNHIYVNKFQSKTFLKKM